MKQAYNGKMINANTYQLNGSYSVLVVGQTNAGKSYLAHKLIENFEKTHSPQELKYALFDLKRAEFTSAGEDYREDYLLFDVVSDPEMALERLHYLAGVADSRVRFKVRDPAIFIYIEECDAAWTDQKRFDDAVVSILRSGKETNMTLVYSTSRPEQSTISDRLLGAFEKVLVGAVPSPEYSAFFSMPFEPLPRYHFRLLE